MTEVRKKAHANEGHSPTREYRGVNQSEHQRKAREQGTLTSYWV
jgi:hypothetical protein